MPTGYTAPIYEGTDITFEQFALRCARAFGAFVHQRDEGADTPPRAVDGPSDHMRSALANGKALLVALQSLDAAEVEAMYQAEVGRMQAEHDEAVARNDAMAARYDDMAARAEAWQPPERWKELRQFMLDQLAESRAHDIIDPGKWDANRDEVANLKRLLAPYAFSTTLEQHEWQAIEAEAQEAVR